MCYRSGGFCSCLDLPFGSSQNTTTYPKLPIITPLYHTQRTAAS
ncbi:7994_t:CDS:1 [Funneliformis geosporum]|nr:7994_t:CDS:1 [Funneliformis geosporum]